MSSSRDRSLRPVEVVRRLRLAPDDTVADIGAGAGYFTAELAAAVPRGKVIATDLRPQVLGIALRRARAEQRLNVEVRTARRDDCALEPRSVDLAFMCRVDHHVADRIAFFRVVADTLRGSGRMAVLNFGRFFRANRLAARELGMAIVDEWWASSDHFLMVLAH